MHVLKAYEQTAIYDPTNPTQRKREVFTDMGPGGYSSFYWNQVPVEAQLGNPRSMTRTRLNGLGGTGFWSGLPTWMQAAIVGAAAVGVGYFGMAKYGTQIKSKLGLSGSRRRR